MWEAGAHVLGQASVSFLSHASKDLDPSGTSGTHMGPELAASAANPRVWFVSSDINMIRRSNKSDIYTNLKNSRQF